MPSSQPGWLAEEAVVAAAAGARLAETAEARVADARVADARVAEVADARVAEVAGAGAAVAAPLRQVPAAAATRNQPPCPVVRSVLHPLPTTASAQT